LNLLAQSSSSSTSGITILLILLKTYCEHNIIPKCRGGKCTHVGS
jgi:hypothetical protein